MKQYFLGSWRLITVAVCLLGGGTRATQAQTTNTWINSGPGFWDETNRWSAGIAPTSTFALVSVTNAPSKPVTIDNITSSNFPGTLIISNLFLSGPVGTVNTLVLFDSGTIVPLRVMNAFTISSGGNLNIQNGAVQVDSVNNGAFAIDGGVLLSDVAARLTTTNNDTRIGSTGDGTLTIQAGAWQGKVVDVGFLGGSQGTLTVAGGTSDLSSAMIVGDIGAGSAWVTGGQLTVTNNFTYISYVGSGQMTVSNGTWQARDVNVGRNAGSQGTLTVAGGTNELSSSMSVGNDAGATGAVWVTGGQLTVTNGETYVGYSGVGQMTVSNGTWRPREVYLGLNPGSQGTLTVAGGTNELSLFLRVGNNTEVTGAVWVTGGQLTVTNTETDVGYGGSGQMTVSNGTWRAERVFVGLNAGSQGTLTIVGGTNQLSLFLSMGESAAATGAVWVTGGQLTVTNDETDVGYSGVGQMTVSNATWLARNMLVGANAGSQGTLTIAGGTSTISANLIVGRFACDSTAIVNVNAGTLAVTNTAVNAVLEVRGGTLTLSGGTLTVDTFVMTNACGRFVKSGGALSITTTNLAPSLDADGDGLFNGWETTYGLSPFSDTGNDGPDGDPDGDGQSNLAEFTIGTDPTDANSFLRITSIVVTNNTDVLITWPITPNSGNGNVGMGYNLLWGTNVNGGITNLLANFFINNGPATTTNHLDVGGATNVPARFYRVQGFPD